MRFPYFLIRPLLETIVPSSLLDFYNLIVLQIPRFFWGEMQSEICCISQRSYLLGFHIIGGKWMKYEYATLIEWWELLSSELLGSEYWEFLIDISGKSIRPLLDSWPLKMGPKSCPY
jgi:hypothetical protein